MVRPLIRPIYNPLVRSVAGSDGGGNLVITVQPVDAVVGVGEDAVFTVDAEGTKPITYQWWEYK